MNFDISTEIGTAIVGSPIDGRIVVTASNDETVKIVVTDESKLPPGVTLSADGKLTGTPTKAGEYTFPIEVCAGQGGAGQGGAGQACAQTEIAVTVGEPQAPEWEVSVEFEGSLGKAEQRFHHRHRHAPGETVVFTVEDPAKLPPGLTISEDVKITGTPTKAGEHPVPIKICAGDVCMRVVITITIVESTTSTQLEVVIEGFTGYVGHEVTARRNSVSSVWSRSFSPTPLTTTSTWSSGPLDVAWRLAVVGIGHGLLPARADRDPERDSGRDGRDGGRGDHALPDARLRVRPWPWSSPPGCSRWSCACVHAKCTPELRRRDTDECP